MFNHSDYKMVREDTLDTLDNWAKHCWPPGSFCQAVLENNLKEAFGRADMKNRNALFDICRYVYNELPSGCQGSPANTRAWKPLPDEIINAWK